MLLRFENLKFFKLYMDYHLSKFEVFWLSGSYFMEVSVKYPHFPIVFGNDVIMTSFIIVMLLNLHILLNIT